MREAHEINLSWLLRLRWAAAPCQLAVILIVHRVMGIHLPLAPLFILVGVQGASNVAAVLWLRRGGPVAEWMPGAVVALDVLLLTGILFYTGGPFNPFSSLYLVHVVLAAVILGPRWTWAVTGLSLAAFGALFVHHVWLPLDHGSAAADGHQMRLHMEGMWVAFGAGAAFIVYFVHRVRSELARREEELARVRAVSTRTEKLASLATLAAGAAHELSTPLSTIAVVAKELERGLADGSPTDAAADTRLIREQVERCRAILEQMSADAGHAAGEAVAPVAVVDVVREAVKGRGGGPAPVLVVVDDEVAGVAVTAPRRALAQALRGLLENARQASPPDAEVVLRVAGDRAACRIEVRDRGAGMAPDVLARAGEPFFSTKGPGRGMGLGLFLARTLVEGLGGRLELDSAPGRGTTVVVHLAAAAGGTA